MRGVKWVEDVQKVLHRRGVELPVSWVSEFSGEVSGTPLSEYHSSPVTIFTAVNTLGGKLDEFSRWLNKQGITVGQAITLIDRSPDGMTETLDEKVPLSAVVRLPLRLYGPDEEILFSEFAFLPPIPKRPRDISQYALLLIS